MTVACLLLSLLTVGMETWDGRRAVSRDNGASFEFVSSNDVPASAAPVRPWRIYVVKATHTDIGLHNSQYIQRHGTVKRIEDAMRLVDGDAHGDDDPVAYRYVAEGTWFWENFPMDRGETAAWNVISNYVRRGRIDIACSCAGNHTHVMGPEELRRSALAKRRLATQWGVTTRTMIMADNPGISWSVVRPYAEAGVENVIFAPNQWNPFPSTLHRMNRTFLSATWNPDAGGGGNYIDVSYDSERPMVFKWESCDRSTNLLVWCSTQYDHGLERVGVQWWGAKIEDVERKMPGYLAILERKYPYDIWLVCNYADDEEANRGFADFAAAWNRKWKWPQFVTVGRLDEPFDELRRRFGDRIPTVRGEMTSGWLQHVASTPELLSAKLAAERRLVAAERAWRADPRRDESLKTEIDRAWWYLVLNDEHSYGTSGYQGRRVFETWMQHRDWIERAAATAEKVEKSVGLSVHDSESRIEARGAAENRWYRVRVNDRGELESIYDKDLGRELLDGTANRLLYTRDNHKTWSDEKTLGAAITRRVFLSQDEKRIDIEDRFDHAADLFNTNRYYRYGYVAFPFAVPKGAFKAMLGGGEVIDPYRDQSGYATDAYVAVREWCAVENDAFGIALRQQDTMLTEFGEIHPDKTCFAGVPPKGKSAIYSYAFTDWLQMHVPDGEAISFTLRYSIRSYRTGEWAFPRVRAESWPLTGAEFATAKDDAWTGLIETPRAGPGEKDGQLYLLWGAELSPRFDHYELWRDDGFCANVTNEAPNGIAYRVARYVDLDAGSHTTRTYRVRKVMKDGTKGAFSKPFSGKTRQMPEPPGEAPFAFRRELERVHERGLRDPSVRPATNEFAFADGCAVGDADLAHFLSESMGVRATTAGSPIVVAAVEASLPPRTYEIAVTSSGVRLTGADRRALRQAYCRLEQRLGLRGGPFLPLGVERRRPLFETRMTHSAWRVDRFPDAYLDRIVHAGFDSVMIFLKDVGVTRAESGADIPGAKFKRDAGERPCAGDVVSDVIHRAAAKGLDTWLYSYVRAPIHPDEPDADAKFEASYGRIAAAYPNAHGIILVGESVAFPSRDPRTSPTGADGKHRPGFFPCSDYPAWLEGMKRAVHRHAPKMEIVFWSYNWGWVDERPRLELLAKLPKDVIAMATFEMFETAWRRNGFVTSCDDYSLAFPLPGRYYLSEAAAAKELGLRFYAMTCTSGLTWDLGTVPCEPFPQLWKERFNAVADSARRHGLAGLMENHTMGWTPNFISELANEAFTEGGVPFDEMLAAIARRDFGATNVTRAVAAWDGWSRAARDMVPMVENQYGPLRIGPAYPFNFFGRRILKSEVPQTPGYSSVLFCDLNYNEPFAYCRDSDGTERPFDEVAERRQVELFEHMAWAFDCGTRVFENLVADGQTPRQRRETERMVRWGRYWTCAMRTVAHVKRGMIAYRRGDHAEVNRLASVEYANAEEALKLVRADSRLGFEPAAGYVGGPAQIEWKLRRMRETYPVK